MKYRMLLLFCSALISCAQPERIDPDKCDPVARLKIEPVKIDPATPPSGEEAIRTLLKNQSLL